MPNKIDFIVTLMYKKLFLLDTASIKVLVEFCSHLIDIFA